MLLKKHRHIEILYSAIEEDSLYYKIILHSDFFDILIHDNLLEGPPDLDQISLKAAPLIKGERSNHLSGIFQISWFNALNYRPA